MKRQILFTICVVLALAATLIGTQPVSAQAMSAKASLATSVPLEQLLKGDGTLDLERSFQGSLLKDASILANAQTGPSTTVFVSELFSGNIVKVDGSGTKTVFASGLSRPRSLKFDKNGNLFVVTDAGLLKIAPTGSISTFTTDLPTTDLSGYIVDLIITDDGKPFVLTIGREPTIGDATSSIWELVEGGTPLFLATTLNEAPFGQSARSFTTGPGGDFYLAMQGGHGGGRILRVTRTGQVSTFFDPGLPPFSSGGGDMTDVRFNSQGEMLILGHVPPLNTHMIWKVQDGILSTFVSPGEIPDQSLQLTIDPADNLFVSGGGFGGCPDSQIDCFDGFIQRVDPFGNVTRLATLPRRAGEQFNTIMDIDDDSFDSFLSTDNAGGPYRVNEGASVSLMATGGDLVNEPLTYAWDLNNDGSFETPGQSVTFSAAALDGPSAYTIKVQVTDNGGLTATYQTAVYVFDVAPTAGFASTPSSLLAGESAALSFSNPFDPGGADAAAGFHYSYDCTNDGTFELANSSDTLYSCGYPAAGIFTARGRISDKDGGFTDYTVEVIAEELVQTPSGSNVTVSTASGTTLTFASVSSAGVTTLTPLNSAPPLPTGFSLGDQPTFYEITTTAIYSAPVIVCITYDPAQYSDPAYLHLLHYENNEWVDVTIPDDTSNHLICGQVSSLSPFTVAERTAYKFSGFFPPVDNLPTFNVVKAGSAVPVKFSLGGDQGLDIFDTGYPISQEIACKDAAPMDNIEQTVSVGDSGLQYDATTDTYTYVWKTQKSWSGTCRQLIVRSDDGRDHIANFKFTK